MPENPVPIPHAQTSGTRPVSLPVDRWPRYARWIASVRKDGDRGVGDTVARKLDKVGDKFKVWFKRITGFDCGCADRQALLNSLYPYPAD